MGGWFESNSGETNIFIFLKNKLSWLFVLLIVLCIWVYFTPKFVSQSLTFDKYQNIEQSMLLDEIKELTEKPINSVLVEPYESSSKKFRKEIKKSDEVKKVADFLKNADKKPTVGGHVLPIYECTVTFISKDKKSTKLLVQVFSDKPSDAYLYHMVSIYDKKGDSSRWATKPVYVAGFGSWLRSEEPGGIE
ncbi:MAG TPA: hypothetical protein VMV05_09690 [bacterium]|nr:hypothetical protein [bacterium]